jgi:hypothetical protein
VLQNIHPVDETWHILAARRSQDRRLLQCSHIAFCSKDYATINVTLACGCRCMHDSTMFPNADTDVSFVQSTCSCPSVTSIRSLLCDLSADYPSNDGLKRLSDHMPGLWKDLPQEPCTRFEMETLPSRLVPMAASRGLGSLYLINRRNY